MTHLRGAGVAAKYSHDAQPLVHEGVFLCHGAAAAAASNAESAVSTADVPRV